MENYKEYQSKVTSIVGKDKANEIFKGAIHLLSTGSSDFLQSYYINPILNVIVTPDRFSDRLMRFYSTVIQVTKNITIVFNYPNVTVYYVFTLYQYLKNVLYLFCRICMI